MLYSLKLKDLAVAGLDTTKVNTPLVFFPSFGAMAGFDIQLDNIRLTKDVSTEPPTNGTTFELYSDGLDLTKIKLVMIFPAWNIASGAIYRIDNIEFKE